MDNQSVEKMLAPKLLDQVKNAIRIRHYSLRTEASYVYWVRWFIRYNGLRHPRDMGVREVTAFLTHLAVDHDVASATQHQALSALLFLYKQVLEINLPWLDEVVRPKKPVRLPAVLNEGEVECVLALMSGVHGLMARLIYGAGLRLSECLRLRVKDVDFVRREVMVRDGKGAKDRVTMLPLRLVEPLREHLGNARRLFDADLLADRPGVYLPHALERKYPAAGKTGRGFGYSRQIVSRSIHVAGLSGDIMSMNDHCNVRSRRAWLSRYLQDGIGTYPAPFLCHPFVAEWL